MHILALHGFTGRGSDFAPLADSPGAAWHCPDLPGHGPGPALDCGPPAMLAFVGREAPRSRPRVLIGYSMGARAGLLHALENPGFWDGLVLVGAAPGLETPARRAARLRDDAALAGRIGRVGAPAFLEDWARRPLIRSQRRIRPGWLAAMRDARAAHTAAGLAAALRGFGQGAVPDLRPRLSALATPTLLLTGENDAKYTALARDMAARLPRAEHFALPEAGHMAHLEAPAAARAAIESFCARLQAPGA